MIKIIKRGSKATKIYRITCKTCNSIFNCPVCNKTLYWGYGYPTDLCSVETYIKHVDY